MRSVSIGLTLFICLVAAVSRSAEPQDRRAKVLGDKRQFVENRLWIYNDLPKAFTAAEETGKPLLIVFRCVPCEACSEFDNHLLEKQHELQDVLEQFVCVRMVFANGLDLSLFQFDYDQSFHAMVLSADRTILARYGTRSQRPEGEDMSVEGFRSTLITVLEDLNRAPLPDYSGKQPLKLRHDFDTPEEFPALAGKYNAAPDYEGHVVQTCIHCHQVRDAERDWHRRHGPIPDDVLFPFPLPDVVGLKLDSLTARSIESVQADSFAGQAGLRAGDQILTADGQPIYSAADLQWVLHTAGRRHNHPVQERQPDEDPTGNQTIVLKLQVLSPQPGAEEDRAGKSTPLAQAVYRELEIALPNNFRRLGDLSWRPTTWDLRRMATGGMVLVSLAEANVQELPGLPAGTPALYVKHVGQYGNHAVALRAGFQVGDVILAVDGKPCPQRETDFILLALRPAPGTKIPVTVLRGNVRVELQFPTQ